jgi:6-phosphogluconolactonase
MEISKGVDVVIGGYSPSVYVVKAGEQTASPVLQQTNPSYIVKHQKLYYIANEQANGSITVTDENFKVLTVVPTMGDDPCQLTFDHKYNYIVAANYTSGSAIVYKLVNHLPTQVHAFIVHEGHGPNPDRQASPHCHSSAFSEDNGIMLIADLGTDIVYYYDFSSDKVSWNKDKSLKIEGAGPRTLANGRKGSQLIYLSCELDNTVRVLSYSQNGLNQIIAYKISQNPTNYPAEVHYFRNQVFLALRGDDKIMIFDEKEDKLEVNCSFKVKEFPRHFSISG